MKPAPSARRAPLLGAVAAALALLLLVVPGQVGASKVADRDGPLPRLARDDGPRTGDPRPPAALPASPAPSGGTAPGATAPSVAARPTLDIPYRVEVRSPDPALAGAAEAITAILEDPRGWQRADIDFRLDPAAAYVVVLVEGEEAQRLCQPYDVGGRFSCQNGPLVVLNAIRWREAVPHWPGVSPDGTGDAAALDGYRTMLVNHEVGHLLGMHHLRCQQPGTPAPVMEQQSGTLRGCTANPWPTAIEVALAATHQFRLAPPPLDVPFPQ